MYRQYAHTANQPAESYDLPLSAAAAAHGDQLRAEHPMMLASTYRYAVPEIPAKR